MKIAPAGNKRLFSEIQMNSYEFDLIANQYMLHGETDEMFEIKYPERDIRIKVMQR